MYAQRVTRYRLPSRPRSRAPLVVAARESFSQSSAHGLDQTQQKPETTYDVTLLRFVHRGFVVRPASLGGEAMEQVRFIFRLDLSALFPRLHDAVRGLASLDHRTGRIAIVDVPRNYQLPLAANLHWTGGTERCVYSLVLNKNGLVRVEER
jgi:hypothetical protein